MNKDRYFICFTSADDTGHTGLKITLSSPFGFSSQKTPIEFFGLPFHDEILHCANLTGVDGMLTACSGVLQDIGKRRIYDDHLSLPPTGETKESFFRELAKLAPEDQEKCFRRIVTTLDDSEGDVEHVKNHLLNGKSFK